MRGFIEGLVYVTIIGQVPHLLGISGASGNFFTKFWSVLQHLPDVWVAPALTGIACLTAMHVSLCCASHTSGARRHGHSNDLDRSARRRDDWCARGRPHSIRVAPPDITEPRHRTIA